MKVLNLSHLMLKFEDLLEEYGYELKVEGGQVVNVVYDKHTASAEPYTYVVAFRRKRT